MIVQNSTKISTEQVQYIVSSKSIVFFRVIFENDRYKLMTATASEGARNFKVYDAQDRLISSTLAVLNDLDWDSVQKKDHAERRYIEARGFQELSDIEAVATRILDSLGFEDISVLARQEMRAIYDDLSIDESGEDGYLNDGVYLSKNGDLTSR